MTSFTDLPQAAVISASNLKDADLPVSALEMVFTCLFNCFASCSWVNNPTLNFCNSVWL